MRDRSRSGFSLIELLVGVFVISLLIALIFPAIQQSRETARRTQCTNNLKQLGLAIHSYHDANGMFPIHQGYGVEQARFWGAFPLLLPYLDQAAVYNQLNFQAETTCVFNSNVLRARAIPVQQCPSDPYSSNKPYDFTPGGCSFGPAVNSGCGGTNCTPTGLVPQLVVDVS